MDPEERYMRIRDLFGLIYRTTHSATESYDLIREWRPEWVAATREISEEVALLPPGVTPIEEYEFRVELILVGLHSQPRRGIASTIYHNQVVAVSLVATPGILDRVENDHMLVYVGEGGSLVEANREGRIVFWDQTMDGGNLALRNSIVEGNLIRVIVGEENVHEEFRYHFDAFYTAIGGDVNVDNGNIFYEFYLQREDSEDEDGD